jgi:hypothetical protein
MNSKAIITVAAFLALMAAGLALALSRGETKVDQVASTVSATMPATKVLIPAAVPKTPVAPTLKRCGDDSDPTGDDQVPRTAVECGAADANRGRDQQASDRRSDDARDDRAGDAFRGNDP